MRRAVFCAVLLYCVLFWRINARALVFCDSMTDLASNSVKDYSGLAPAASSGIPDNVKRAPPAGSGLTLTSGQLTGWAQYRVQGADLVTVDIYTGWGTFVSMPPGEGVYALGMCQQNMGYLGQQQLAQAQLSRSDGGIFARVNGKLYKALDTGYLLTLRESSETPGELIDYGVNVYAAGEDGDFTRLSIASGSQVRVENMRLEWSRAFVFERLSYRVPAGATRVRIEINDHAYLDAQTSPGQTVRRPPATGMRTVLAQAAFSGENLSVGEPEPVVSHEDSRQSSQSAQSGSSRSSSSRRGSGSSAAGAAASKASSGSEFEGQVTSAASSSRASSKKQPSAPASSAGESAGAPSVAEASPEELVQVFRIQPDARGSSGIMLYIVVVLGVIILLLLRGKAAD